MIIFSVLLIIVGLFTVFFGVLQNTVLLTFFDRNAQLSRMLSDVDFDPIWLIEGPGTIAIVIGFIAFVIGIVLLVVRKKKQAQRQVNSSIRNTNKRRKQQGKRVPK